MDPYSAELPHHQTLMQGTDWASLATPCGTGESLPAALARLVDPDPLVREAAVKGALGKVTHQNSICEATMPVALYAAAILDHPALAVDGSRHDDAPSMGRPTLVAVLDWLGETARDADDACVATIPLIEHPALVTHRSDLAGHAHRLLATSTDRYHRDRVLDALKAWGHDTSDLENEADIAARERYAVLRAARASRQNDRATGGGYSEDPPF